MSEKTILIDWLKEALESLGGKATIVEVCECVWRRHEHDLRKSRLLFYTWQYEIRWAAYKLREKGTMKHDGDSPKGIWELS